MSKQKSESANISFDFDVLRQVDSTLTDFLRKDEKGVSLYNQCTQSGSSVPGSHRYFSEPYDRTWKKPQLEYQDFIAFPPEIAAQFNSVDCLSLLGFLPEIQAVWATVDNKLFLWQFPSQGGQFSSSNGQYTVFDEVEQVIVAVGLAAPKASVFTSSVKYLLVVCTPLEVVILALTQQGPKGRIELSLTPFVLPTDNTLFTKVTSTQSGRIFLTGQDGCLYEILYQNEEYFSSLLGASRKIQKRNHTSSPLLTLVPSFLWSIGSVLGTGVTSGTALSEPVEDVVVDDVRHILYTLSSDQNVLEGYDLGREGNLTRRLHLNFRVRREVLKFCENTLGSHVPDAPSLASSSTCFTDF